MWRTGTTGAAGIEVTHRQTDYDGIELLDYACRHNYIHSKWLIRAQTQRMGTGIICGSSGLIRHADTTTTVADDSVSAQAQRIQRVQLQDLTSPAGTANSTTESRWPHRHSGLGGFCCMNTAS